MLDWDDLRTFLAIARSHTLSGAARELGVRQSTMGRRLDALEGRAGVRLLQKTPTGYVLTNAGEAALAHVERMEEEALAVELAVAGRDERLEGLVRLTTIGTLAVSLLPPVLARFHQRYPAITVEVITEGRLLSLSRREADLSLWPARPTGNELIARKIADVPYQIYAGRGYLDRYGLPDLASGAPGHNTILRPESDKDWPDMVFMASVASHAAVALRTGNTDLMIAAAEADMGIACLPANLADYHPQLVRIEAKGPLPRRELWLAVHEDTRRTPRISALMDALVRGLGEIYRQQRADAALTG